MLLLDQLAQHFKVQLIKMNELPVIGSLCLRKDFWDCRGAEIASFYREIYGERLFRRLELDRRFFTAVLSEMNSGSVVARVV